MYAVPNPVALLQIAAAGLLNASFTWLAGSVFTRFCWRKVHSRQVENMLANIWWHERQALLLCCASACGALWAGAAVMSGATLIDAIGMIPVVLFKTAFGQATLLGLLVLLLSGAARLLAQRARMRDFFLIVLLAAFALCRVAVGHGAENGMLSLGLAVEWLHLLLIALWFGAVALAAWVVLPLLAIERQPGAAADCVKIYMTRLSHTATLALAGILATGIYNAWQRLGTPGNLSGNVYGNVLSIKLLMVALAVVLGGYNKFFGFPAFADSGDNKQRVMVILRIESVLLLGALMAAAVLTSQQPPASF